MNLGFISFIVIFFALIGYLLGRILRLQLVILISVILGGLTIFSISHADLFFPVMYDSRDTRMVNILDIQAGFVVFISLLIGGTIAYCVRNSQKRK